MIAKLGSALFLAALLTTTGSAANATVYFDPAAWLTAVEGLEISAPNIASRTTTVTTAETDEHGTCCTILGTTTEPGGGQSLNLSAVGLKVDEFCFSVPNCTVSGPSAITYNFVTPIMAFATFDMEIGEETLGTGFLLNGDPVQFTQRVSFNSPFFFGVVEPLSSVTIGSPCPLCDNLHNTISIPIEFTAIAPVSEPPTAVCLLAALGIFTAGGIARRRRKPQSR